MCVFCDVIGYEDTYPSVPNDEERLHTSIQSENFLIDRHHMYDHVTIECLRMRTIFSCIKDFLRDDSHKKSRAFWHAHNRRRKIIAACCCKIAMLDVSCRIGIVGVNNTMIIIIVLAFRQEENIIITFFFSCFFFNSGRRNGHNGICQCNGIRWTTLKTYTPSNNARSRYHTKLANTT